LGLVGVWCGSCGGGWWGERGGLGMGGGGFFFLFFFFGGLGGVFGWCGVWWGGGWVWFVVGVFFLVVVVFGVVFVVWVVGGVWGLGGGGLFFWVFFVVLCGVGGGVGVLGFVVGGGLWGWCGVFFGGGFFVCFVVGGGGGGLEGCWKGEARKKKEMVFGWVGGWCVGLGFFFGFAGGTLFSWHKGSHITGTQRAKVAGKKDKKTLDKSVSGGTVTPRRICSSRVRSKSSIKKRKGRKKARWGGGRTMSKKERTKTLYTHSRKCPVIQWLRDLDMHCVEKSSRAESHRVEEKENGDGETMQSNSSEFLGQGYGLGPTIA